MDARDFFEKNIAVFHPVPIHFDGKEFTSNSITFRSILIWSSHFDKVDLVTYLNRDASTTGKHKITNERINVIGMQAPDGRMQLYLTRLAPLLIELIRVIHRNRRKWDMVVLFDVYMLNVVAYYICRMLRIPVVMRMVGRYDLFVRESLRYEGKTKRVLGAIYGRLTAMFQARLASRGVVVTDGDDSFAPPQARHRIGFSVESNLMSKDIPKANPYVEKPPGRPPRVLTVGRVHPVKGAHVLVDAIRAMRDRGQEVELDIVGPTYGSRYGNYEEKLRRAVHERGNDAVRFHGWLDDGAVVEKLWQQADVFVVPCVSNADGVPRVIFEAMARGLPVVATRIGGVGRVIVHGCTGMVVPPADVPSLADAIGSLVTDDRLRMGISDNSFRAVNAFTAEAVSGRLAAMLSTAADNTSRKGEDVAVLSKRFPFPTGGASWAKNASSLQAQQDS